MGERAGMVIVGAGPAGLLLANMLLQGQPKPELLPVRIFEARDDPRIPLPPYQSRQYCVGLSARGQDAIKRVEGLWEGVAKEGMPTSQFVLHSGTRSISLKRNPEKPSLLINQRALAAAFLTNLERRWPKDHLQDVVMLERLIQEEDDIDIALERYSQYQAREDHAAAYLSEFAFPQVRWVLPFFYLGNIATPALSKVFPPSILAPSIQSLCSETLTSYSEIERKHQ